VVLSGSGRRGRAPGAAGGSGSRGRKRPAEAAGGSAGPAEAAGGSGRRKRPGRALGGGSAVGRRDGLGAGLGGARPTGRAGRSVDGTAALPWNPLIYTRGDGNHQWGLSSRSLFRGVMQSRRDAARPWSAGGCGLRDSVPEREIGPDSDCRTVVGRSHGVPARFVAPGLILSADARAVRCPRAVRPAPSAPCRPPGTRRHGTRAARIDN
jgi:hypothetical protein